MSDNEEERHSCKTIILHGPDNFAQWELSIGTTRLGKGLLDCISTDVPLGLPVKEAIKKDFDTATLSQLLYNLFPVSYNNLYPVPLAQLPHQIPNWFGTRLKRSTLPQSDRGRRCCCRTCSRVSLRKGMIRCLI